MNDTAADFVARNTTETILEQLGGNRFLVMTGAVALASETDRALTLKLPRISKVSALVITLDVLTDTYRVEVYRGRGLKMQPAGQPIYHLHADQLRGTFTYLTGLHTSL